MGFPHHGLLGGKIIVKANTKRQVEDYINYHAKATGRFESEYTIVFNENWNKKHKI